MKFKLTVPKIEIEFEAESIEKAFDLIDSGEVSYLERAEKESRLTSEVCLLCSTPRKPLSWPDDDYRCPNDKCALFNKRIE